MRRVKSRKESSRREPDHSVAGFLPVASGVNIGQNSPNAPVGMDNTLLDKPPTSTGAWISSVHTITFSQCPAPRSSEVALSVEAVLSGRVESLPWPDHNSYPSSPKDP